MKAGLFILVFMFSKKYNYPDLIVSDEALSEEQNGFSWETPMVIVR